MPFTHTTFAIIGCGNIGKRHAKHIQSLATLKAVCDVDIAKANVLAQEYNIPAYASFSELLENEKDVSVLSICTPNGLHAEHSIAALKAGHHVICEKPMAITSADCLLMIEASKQAGKQLFIVKQNRFNNAVVAVKDAINKGALGKILSFQLNCFWNRNDQYYNDSWHGTKNLDGGTLFTQFSHFIDVLYWFIGDVETTQSFLKNLHHQNSISFEDTGVAILHMQNGAIGTLNYTVNSFNENMEGSLTLFGEKGTVKIGGQYLNTIQYQNIKDYIIADFAAQNVSNDYGTYKGSMSNHDQVYKNVLDVLNNGSAASVSVFEGLKTVEIIEKIYAASAQ